MKITNDDLRLIASSSAPYGKVDDAAMALELLQRRYEVKRLRAVLRSILRCQKCKISGHAESLSAALAPKRKRRAK